MGCMLLGSRCLVYASHMWPGFILPWIHVLSSSCSCFALALLSICYGFSQDHVLYCRDMSVCRPINTKSSCFGFAMALLSICYGFSQDHILYCRDMLVCRPTNTKSSCSLFLKTTKSLCYKNLKIFNARVIWNCNVLDVLTQVNCNPSPPSTGCSLPVSCSPSPASTGCFTTGQ